MRVEYGSVEKDGSPDLDVDWLADGWVALLRKWLADAESAGVAEPNAMVVGTVDDEGRPATRSVLCKSVDETGITFFTNYDSAKGRGTRVDAVRVGDVPVVSARPPGARPRPGDQGVRSRSPPTTGGHRPRGSQLGAWASHQSSPIASRAALLRPIGRRHGTFRRPR